MLLVFAADVWQMVHHAAAVFLDPTSYRYAGLWKTREFGEILILLAPFVWLIPELFARKELRLVTAADCTGRAPSLPTGYRAHGRASPRRGGWIVGHRRWKCAVGTRCPGADRGHRPVPAGKNMAQLAISRGLDDNHRIKYIWKPTLEYVKQRPIAGYGYGQQIFMTTLQSDPRADSE